MCEEINKIELYIQRVFNIIFGAFFVFITLVCIFFTHEEYYIKNLWLSLTGNIPNILFLIIGFFALITGSLFFLKKNSDCAKITKVIVGLSLGLLALQIFLTYNYYFMTDWDAGGILNAAETLARNESLSQDYENYFSRYPNNLLFLSFMSGIVRVSNYFGIYSLLFIIVLQCIVSWISGLLLFFTVSRILGNRWISLYSYVIYLVLVWSSPWVSIPYTDSLSLMFPIFIMFLFTRRPQSKKAIVLKWFIIGFITYIGYSLKPQVSFITVSVLLVSFLHVLFNKSIKKTNLCKSIVCVIGIIIAFFIVKGVNSQLDIIADKNKIFGSQHFLMMGLNTESMGGYNGSDVKYSMSFDTKEKRDKADLSMAKERLKKMGLPGFSKLMVQKTLTNYNDGTFCWGGEGVFYKEIYPDKNSSISPFLKNIYYNRNYSGKYTFIWKFITQCVWMGIIVLVIFAVNIKSPSKEITAIMISLIILTIFQSLFEARARYLYIYSPMFIILAIQGCKNIYNLLTRKNIIKTQ